MKDPRLKTVLRALRHRNYRLFFAGQLISLVGTWMQMVAQPWLVYRLTGSSLLLGTVGFVSQIPVFLLAFVGGTVADRYNRHRVVIATQTAAMVLAFILSALTLTGMVRIWHIFVLSALLGIVNSFDMPGRQAFIVELVEKEDLMNAIGLNSTVFNGARIAGPAIAGVLMAGIGIGFCFLINALSFLPLIIGLFFIHPIYRQKSSSNSILGDISDGIKYMFSEKILRNTLIIVFIIGTFIVNFNVLIPVLAKSGLHLEEKGFGFLMSSVGAGSLLGALFITLRSKHGPKNILLIGSALLVSATFILIGLNNNLFMAAFLLAVSGFMTVTFMTTANSTIQLNSKDEFRSRVLSFYMLVNAGTTPIGNLTCGTD